MIGVVLCSGPGKKMWPFTDWWQKCCMPAGNRPNVLRVVRQLKSLGLSRVYVAASYRSEMVRYALRAEPGVEVIEEQSPVGTAQSLLRCINGAGEDVLAVYGDAFVEDARLWTTLKTFKEQGRPVILTQSLDVGQRSVDWMCAMVRDGLIQAIYGHPRSHYVNARVAGAFALPAGSARYLEANPGHMESVCVGGMPPKESPLEQSLQMMLDDGVEIASVESGPSFVDMDKPWHILEANYAAVDETLGGLAQDFLGEGSSVDDSAVIQGRIRLGRGSRIGKNVMVRGDLWVGDDTVIDSGAIIEGRVVIGDRCTVMDHCMLSSHTVIGNRNRIGFGAQVHGVTLDGVSIMHSSYTYGLVGSHTDIAAGCLTGSLRFDDSSTVQEIHGRREAAGPFANAVFFGDHTRTGVGDIFLPGVKIGVNCAIWPGAIIDSDVASNSLIVVEQQKSVKRWGPERYGW